MNLIGSGVNRVSDGAIHLVFHSCLARHERSYKLTDISTEPEQLRT